MNLLTLQKAGLIWLGILLPVACYGQQVEIPLGALPMQYNSSFAGEAGGPRISSSFGYGIKRYASVLANSAYYLSHSYILYTSYDQFIPKLRTGIGFTAGVDGSSATNGASKGTYVAFAIAPKFPIKGKVTISPSIDVRYSSYKGLSDFIDDKWRTKGNSFTTRAGLLINTPKFYIGYSANMLSNSAIEYTYHDSTFSGVSPKGFTSFLQMGYTFQRSSESNFSFTPQLLFQIGSANTYYGHGLVHLEAVNLNFRYKKFIWGISNAGLHVGLQTKKFKAAVANSFGFSSSSNLYGVNLSLRYTFKSDN
jgi:hypothetical protein